MPSKDEFKMMKMATMYELRLIIKGSDKEQYTKEELLDLLDVIAEAKEQQN